MVWKDFGLENNVVWMDLRRIVLLLPSVGRRNLSVLVGEHYTYALNSRPHIPCVAICLISHGHVPLYSTKYCSKKIFGGTKPPIHLNHPT